MEVTTGSELALLCMAVHIQEAINMQCKQMWTFFEVFICGK